MNEIERRVLAALDTEGLIACLGELLAFPSVGGREDAAQARVADLMADAGLEVDRWDIDLAALRDHPAYSAEIRSDSAVGVVGRLGAGDGPALILNAHVDVVPAGEEVLWSVPPFAATRRGERIYGRGSTDTKGGLCCALFAVRAVRDAGVGLPGSVQLQSVIGEEDGGAGTLATILRGHRGDGAIVLEPTAGVIAPAQAGALGFRLTVPGRAAHGALRTEGVDPFEHYLPLHAAMRAFEAERNRDAGRGLFAGYELPFALCIGRLSSGVWPSTVAEFLHGEGRLGVAPGEDPATVRQAFEARIMAAAAADPWLAEHPPTLAWSGARFDPAAIAADHPLVTTLAGAHEAATGNPAVVRGVPYGADMRLLVNEAGIPAVIYGPGDIRRAHAPDEYVTADELTAAARALALAVLRFCGAAGAG